MAYLDFISDEDLIAACSKLVMCFSESQLKAENDYKKNVLDPFAALIGCIGYGIDFDEWLITEKARQAQKSVQNAIGDFHQNILGSMPGWKNAGVGGGFDVGNEELKIIAEIKNKHNTLNSGGASEVYKKLANYLQYNKNFEKAFLVQIIPASPKRYQTPFAVSKELIREDILKIDGYSFYGFASGRENAMAELYEVLPGIISELFEIETKVNKQTLTELFKSVFIVK